MQFNFKLYSIPINFTIKDISYKFNLISCAFLFRFFKLYFAEYLGFVGSFAIQG